MKTLLWSMAAVLAANPIIQSVAAQQDIPFYDGEPNFLFIGNSYTSSNKLAEMTTTIISEGVPEWADDMYTISVNPPGRNLVSHADEADGTNGETYTRGYLVTNAPAWKWVVLQDQSQTPGLWQYPFFEDSLQAVSTLNDLIAATGGQTVFFMTWGRREGDTRNFDIYPDFLTMQGMITEGYMRYVKQTSTSQRPTYVAPVGLVFQTIYNDLVQQGIDPVGDTLFRRLYQNDGSHPAPHGTYVAALTIYSTMTGRSPKDITSFVPDPSITADDIENMQDAVSRTILSTFESGTIVYPWKTPFSAEASGTLPPTTPATTVTSAPVTPPPAPAPTSTTQRPAATPSPVTQAPASNNNGNTKGFLRVTFQMDDFPQEIAWTMVPDQDNATPLYFQPFDSVTQPGALVTKTFDNLLPGNRYSFKAIDANGDGVCCTNGFGYLTISDDPLASSSGGDDSNALVHSKGYFKTFLQMTFEILPNGRATIVGKATHYQAGTWPDYEDMIAPVQENEWPGAMPTEPTYSLMVNIDLDDHPEDISWTLSHYNGQQWNVVDEWDGTSAQAQPGQLESLEFSNLEQGWYLFLITDSQENGLCCDSGRGYVSLTGPLASANGEMGLVWGNNGQYLEQDAIQFLMGKDGYIWYIRW